VTLDGSSHPTTVTGTSLGLDVYTADHIHVKLQTMLAATSMTSFHPTTNQTAMKEQKKILTNYGHLFRHYLKQVKIGKLFRLNRLLNTG
jgi:hypothetical protein